MLRGLYLTAMGMVAQEMRQDVISNNLANATTPGFKGETATIRSFPEVLLQRLAGNEAAPIGPFSPGVMIDGIHTNFTPGALTETGQATDLALVQPGVGVTPAFFTVRTPGGLAYTRNGNFHLDASGLLVTAEGYPVQGQNGDITFRDQFTNELMLDPHFKVDSSGRVIIHWPGPQGQQQEYPLDSLQITTFANTDLPLLQRQGDHLFTAPPGVQPLPAANVQVKQGWLEQANIDPTREMVDMLSVLRSYEANQKVIQTEDQTLGKSVNEVGSLR